LLVVSCRTSAQAPGDSSAGETYWQDKACTFVKFPEDAGPDGWTFCVDKVVVRTDGAMEFHVRWIGAELYYGLIDKGSDAGNRNMDVVDDRGRRYDHFETRGTAAERTRLDDRFPQAAGAFVFPAPAPGATNFVFRDDDQHVRVEGIALSTEKKTTRDGSRALLGPLEAATTVRIDTGWSGLDRSRKATFALARVDGDFVRHEVTLESGERLPQVRVPRREMEDFLRALAESPILEREYLPTFTHTDDYPHAVIEVDTPTGIVQFSSTSQGPGMVPWKVDVSGRSYVVPDDAPARAASVLSSSLPELRLSVRDQRPQRAANATSTGDLELVEAARYGEVARLRELLASGDDVNERNPYDGATPLEASVSNGQSEAVRVLLAAGASPNGLPDGVVPPLVLATIGQHTETSAP
jgi:hypothetical protein